MPEKPTYEELEQKVKELEKKVADGKVSKKEISQERDLFMKGPVVVFKWAAKENWPAEYVSPSMEQFGYKADDFINNKILYIDIIHPEDVERVVSEVQTYIEAGLSSYEQEYRIIQSDGEVRWVYDHTVVHRDDKNEIIDFNGYIADNTKRKIAEEKLWESEERLAAFMDSATDGFMLFDSELNHIELNKVAQEMRGIERKDIIGNNITDTVPNIKETGRYDEYKKVMKTGVPFHSPDLTSHPLTGNKHIVIKAFKVGDGLGVIVTDITERKQAEKALQKAHEELEQKVKERTKELEIKTKSLEELNMAMKVLLDKRKEDRVLLEDSVLANVKELIEPLFDKMRETELDDLQKTILSIIESNLYEVTSPITRKLSMKHLNLTPTEMKIANLIRHGTTTKKIAKLMNSSPRTIDTHRKNIRGKIGLNKKGGNLRSYLLSLNR